MFDRRRRLSKWYIALAAMAALMVASVGVAQLTGPASTARPGSGDGMIIAEMSLVSEPQTNQITASVTVLESELPVIEAEVELRLTVPDGQQYAQTVVTDNEGVASVTFPSQGDGSYLLEVTDVILDGHVYDPDNNVVESASLTMGNSGSDSPVPPTGGAITVSQLNYQIDGQGNLSLSMLVQSGAGPVANAQVQLKMSMPNGISLEGTMVSGADGVVTVTGQAPIEGVYQVEIVEVNLDGYVYDAANSETSASVVVDEDDGEPTPTATVTETAEPTETPTVTETAEPTETSTETATETATETETAEPTETEPNPNPNPDQPPADFGQWHPPSDHDHGDPPPGWVTSWIQQQADLGVPGLYSVGLIYGGDEATPGEWQNKPRAYKAYSLTIKGVDIYWRYHAQSNPMGQNARFHSYEIFARDPSGEISFWQGWLDFGVGNNTLPTVRDEDCEADLPRPIMMVNKVGCGEFTLENWYSKPGGTGPGAGWMWDTGLNMEATFYHGGDPHNMETWTRAEDNNKGLLRRVELAWYADRTGVAPKGEWFWATQFGTVVSGPDDQACDGSRTFGENTYEVKCIPQYISPTMPTVDFPGNSDQKTFDCPECTMPN